jgi:CRISPR type IV-associated protein Csf3
LLGYVNKRAPVVEYMQLGDGKIKSVNTGTGRNKAFRIPQPRALTRLMRWWCEGDEAEVRSLLGLVTHLGKKRSVGHGKVGRWEVERCEPWPGFPVKRPDGTPMRNLPMDTPGLGPATAVGWGPVTYPYWDQTAAVEVAQAPDTGWMGP